MKTCTNEQMIEYMSDQKEELREHMNVYFDMRESLCKQSVECIRTAAAILYHSDM